MTSSTEEWRAVPGFSGYEVSDQGRVRTFWRRGGRPRLLGETPYLLAPELKQAYLYVRLTGDGKRRPIAVHRLVMLAFVGPRPEGREIRHLDGNPVNNRLDNLRYGTRSENLLDAVRHGTHPSVRRTHCKHGHPFDEANTKIMPRTGWRVCRTCFNADQRARRARVRAAEQAVSA